jgi:MFS family permease
MNPAQLGLVSSIFTLGGLIGALTAGPFSSRYGRLAPMRIVTAFFALGPVAEALAPNIGTMTLGRFISGLGAGAAVVIVPIYISEIAPPGQKGFFGAFTQIMTNLGILITQVLGYFLSRGQMWRVILAFGGAVGLLQLAGLTLAIESPKWQADHGNPKAAKEGLQRIRGHDVDIKEEFQGWGVESEDLTEGSTLSFADPETRADIFTEEQETLLSHQDRVSHHSGIPTKKDTLGIFGVLGSPEHQRALIAVVLVMAAQQFCGQ